MKLPKSTNFKDMRSSVKITQEVFKLKLFENQKYFVSQPRSLVYFL